MEELQAVSDLWAFMRGVLNFVESDPNRIKSFIKFASGEKNPKKDVIDGMRHDLGAVGEWVENSRKLVVDQIVKKESNKLNPKNWFKK